MLDGFWNFAGLVAGGLSLLMVLSLGYLMFVLQRLTGSVWARMALVAAVSALIVSAASALFSVCSSVSGFPGLSIHLDYEVMFRVWGVISWLETVCYSTLAFVFLGLAISARRGKSRVAWRRKT